MSQRVINVKNLYKSFGDTKAVEGIDFHVDKTECFGLLGPNGAGKTTTMKIIYGKSECDKNKDTVLDVFGLDAKKESLAIKSIAGIVPQQDNLDEELNVMDNLLVYAKFYGLDKNTAKQRIDELLKFVELSEKAKSKIRELSGGMQRRLTIARALLNNPKLLILDEPTTGLDPQVRHLIWNKLRELKQNGVTIILTTHYMDEAFQICDRIVIMDKGKKIIEGNPKELLTSNLEKFVMEVYCTGRDYKSCAADFKNSGIRYEVYKDTLFAYSNDYEILAKKGEEQLDYHIRQSNLEDLFLKVTGRSLNELQ
ncbi:MAG TPA: ATP-binding cassette domain-containing protein [Clostridia bacterium]